MGDREEMRRIAAMAWQVGYLRGTLDATGDLEPADNPWIDASVESVSRLRNEVNEADQEGWGRGYRAALRAAARELRSRASDRFAKRGSEDARGAALWDAACHIDPDDKGAI